MSQHNKPNRPQIIRPDEADRIAVDLPAAGFKRREVLAERADELAEAAETVAAATEVEAVDLSKLKPEGEIRQHLAVDPFSGIVDYFIAGLDTSKYRYSLVNSKNPQNSPGMMVSRKIAQGWEPVTHRDPEGKNLPIDAEGRRYIGDTVLMRITLTRMQHLEDQRAQRRAALENVDGTLLALGEQHGVSITPNTNDPNVRRGLMRGMARSFIAQGNVPSGI